MARNFIPGLTKRGSYGVTAVGAVAIGVGLYLLLRSKYSFKPLYEWDDEDMTAVQGNPFTVRLPRGQRYIVASPDVLVQAQHDFANESHLVLVPLPVVATPYELQTVLVEEITGATFPIKFTAVPLEQLGPPSKPKELPA